MAKITRRIEDVADCLKDLGIDAQPTLELPYLDWLKVAAAVERETGDGLDYVAASGDPLITRGCWFMVEGIKVRSCG